MPKYELTFVFDKTKKELVKKLQGYLKDAEAKIIKEEDWGVKPLAYPIKKLDEAKFLYFEIEAETSAVKKLENTLRLEEELIRSLIVRV